MAKAVVQVEVAPHSSSTCRGDLSSRSWWSDIPQELLHPIMLGLQAIGGLKDVAVLRWVCKAWHAAFSEFPASVTCISRHQQDLERMMQMMPAMAELKVGLQSDFQITSLSMWR